MAEKGKWFLVFTLRIIGTNSINEGVNIKREVWIRLHATNEKDAVKQARIFWKEKDITNLPDDIRRLIDDDDELEYSDQRVIYKQEPIYFK